MFIFLFLTQCNTSQIQILSQWIDNWLFFKSLGLHAPLATLSMNVLGRLLSCFDSAQAYHQQCLLSTDNPDWVVFIRHQTNESRQTGRDYLDVSNRKHKFSIISVAKVKISFERRNEHNPVECRQQPVSAGCCVAYIPASLWSLGKWPWCLCQCRGASLKQYNSSLPHFAALQMETEGEESETTHRWHFQKTLLSMSPHDGKGRRIGI